MLQFVHQGGSNDDVAFGSARRPYEAEFAHQEELKFTAREGAVKALATWAAERLGKAVEAADAYVAEVVSADVTHLGLQPTLERVASELGPVGIGKAEV
jgi:hypothetical protein